MNNSNALIQNYKLIFKKQARFDSNCSFYIIASFLYCIGIFSFFSDSDKTEYYSKKILGLNENGAIQALKTKWWADTSCSDAADLVGKSDQASGVIVDIPQLGKSHLSRSITGSKKIFQEKLNKIPFWG